MKLSTVLNSLKGFSHSRNMRSLSGNSIPNQIIIHFSNGSLFQSYNSIIAVKLNSTVYLTDHWDYSTTTGKYRNQFLNEGIAETRKKIEDGEYVLTTGH